MKNRITKLWNLAIKEARKVLDAISVLLGWFLLSTAIGAGLTFGCLLAFSYVIYGS